MSISDNIKAIRASKGVAQAEIARRLDIEPSSYHRLENRGNKLTLEQIDNIAHALGVSRFDILTWGENKAKLQDTEVIKEEKKSFNKLNELEDSFSFMQEYIGFLKRKIDTVYHQFSRVIQYTGEEAKLGTVHTYEETEDYGLYYTTFTNKELNKIFDILYTENSMLYMVFRECIRADTADSYSREVKMFIEHSQRKTKELIKQHGGLFD